MKSSNPISPDFRVSTSWKIVRSFVVDILQFILGKKTFKSFNVMLKVQYTFVKIMMKTTNKVTILLSTCIFHTVKLLSQPDG